MINEIDIFTMLEKSKLNPKTNCNIERNLVGNFSLAEIANFDQLAESWCDPNGQYKTALDFNRVRVSYFIERICLFYERDPNRVKPLKGLLILDVGCGGGLVCEHQAK
jgi:2-polyprenyl-6-hydroxyphenyl methylase/3-demethylubiquinone-9 3-methyltransferase